jgi:hypothetical protein
VVWSRESKGKVVTKHGTIAEVVLPDRVPDRNKFPSLYGRHPESGKDIGKTRKDYSYVVLWKDGSISWPLAQYLSASDEPVGKPLVEVLAGEENDNPHRGSTLDSFLKEEGIYEEVTAGATARIVAENAEGSDPKLNAYGRLGAQDDEFEDVEAQVARDFDKAVEKVEKEANYGDQTPAWNNPSSRMFVGVHDGDGQIKTDSDPDRELGHHLRGALSALILAQNPIGPSEESPSEKWYVFIDGEYSNKSSVSSGSFGSDKFQFPKHMICAVLRCRLAFSLIETYLVTIEGNTFGRKVVHP